MAVRPALNKSSLTRETDRLAEYRRFLPSLELKRLQLLSAKAEARADLEKLNAACRRSFDDLAAALPMLANLQVPLEGLVRVSGIMRGEQNLSGTRLLVVNTVEIETGGYSTLARPHWVDAYVRGMRVLLRLEVERDTADERLRLLTEAEAVISRRVNLFEKVLIPQAQTAIRAIRMALADAERDAVVRAKISKRKTAARAADTRAADL